MAIERMVIGAFVLLTCIVILAIVVLARMPQPTSAEATNALYGALGALISGLIAFVHALPLPNGNHPTA